MARKVVKVYLTPEQKRMLECICQSLGLDESEVLRQAFMEYAKSMSPNNRKSARKGLNLTRLKTKGESKVLWELFVNLFSETYIQENDKL